jgi:hypothetical protein
MFFTRDGLEQASRPEVADYHASRFVQAGVQRVIDIGCGIGSDSLAFARAGLEVVALDVDPVTAVVAQANLGDRVSVICADAHDVADQLMGPGVGVFCDPSRRDDRGRLWRVEDFAPPWSFVTGLLDANRTAGVKLGPALPHTLIPETAEAEWVTHRGDTVEVTLWSGVGASPGRRLALVLAECPTCGIGCTAAARTRTRSLSVRTGRVSHPCRCHSGTGRTTWCRAARSAGRVPDG